MHVAPDGLRAVRQDGITVRFAMLGALAYVLAEIPPSGSTGTSLERPCDLPHWGFVIDGELSFVTDEQRLAIPAGRAFHVPAGGPMHRFETGGAALVAGFQPVEVEIDVSDERLVEQGFEIMTDGPTATIVPAVPPIVAGPGQVAVEMWRMSGYLMNRVRMGERTGYMSGWCDAPHWGLVVDGRFAIEFEDDIEVVAKGDIFHCPAGPPGHRIEAADPATFIDLTPIASLQTAGRLADWRRGWEKTARPRSPGIAVAALG